MSSENARIRYICDGHKCGDACPSPTACRHTLDIEHAANYHRDDCGDFIENAAPLFDFELAEDHQDLMRIMRYINKHGYQLVSVTQDPIGMYTVFFGGAAP